MEAIFVLCAGGYAISMVQLRRLTERAEKKPGVVMAPWSLLQMLCLLGGLLSAALWLVMD